MYIINLQRMERNIKNYLEDEEKQIKKEYEVLDKKTKCMCDLEISFTKDLLKLITDYQDKIKKVTDTFSHGN